LKPVQTGRVPISGSLAAFLASLREINNDWVRMKHREEIEIATILARMKSMEEITSRVRGAVNSRHPG
jgi:hypothetical protein